MSTRFKNAWEMNQYGASNSIAIANAIIEACRDVINEGGTCGNDPAVRLLVHQLSHVTGANDLHYGSDTLGKFKDYMKFCKERM